jgi:spore coat polysaccharide biosynthesis protein SpsF
MGKNRMNGSRVLAIVQARMGSHRLPGKVLCELGGRPMLEWVLRRVSAAHRVDQTIVATSSDPADRPIIDCCERLGVAWFAGSQHDVLDRFARAAERFGAEWIVRITADCPLIDPGILDEVIGLAVPQGDLDAACNVFPRRTFPRGLDVEVVHADVLAELDRSVLELPLREHVTAALYRNSDRYRIGSLEADGDFSTLRWTVDEPADLQLVRAMFAELDSSTFRWLDCLTAWRQHPDWWTINALVQQKVA